MQEIPVGKIWFLLENSRHKEVFFKEAKKIFAINRADAKKKGIYYFEIGYIQVAEAVCAT